jgi:hypothetical protein
LLQQISQRYGAQIGMAYVARNLGNLVIDFTARSSDQGATAGPCGSECGSIGGPCLGNR